MDTFSVRLKFEPLRSLVAASVGATYTAVGDPISHAARQIWIQNLTDGTLMFSFDGMTDHFVLPTLGFFLDDITANKTKDDGFFLKKGDQLFVKQVDVPTTGSVYFSMTYGG